MPSTKPLCLIAIAIFLSACSLPASTDVGCAWVRPIKFSQSTKAWLAEHSPWPDPVRADLEKIARHNDKHRAFCG